MFGTDSLEAFKKNNIVVGNPKAMEDSEIVVEGSGNVLFFGKNAVLDGARIHFTGDNALVYLTTRLRVRADITVASDATLHMGNGTYLHPLQHIRIKVDQGSTVWFGNDILSSINVLVDTNGMEKQLVIGDHVWLCHGATVKGSSLIANNTIVASKARLKDCRTEPFTCWGGENRELLRDVLFSEESMRLSDRLALLNREKLSKEEANSIIALKDIDYAGFVRELASIVDPQERLAAIKRMKKQNKYTHVVVKERQSRKNEAQVRLEGILKGKGENTVVGSYQDDGGNSEVTFGGEGNTLIVEDGVTLRDATIKFQGNGGLVYLSASSHPYRCIISVSSDSSCYIGRDNVFQPTGPIMRISPAEGMAIVIGDGNTFGSRVWVRTSDQHPIYGKKTLKRINPPEGVAIGIGTAIGSDCILQKGAIVDDGATIREESLVMRKKGKVTGPLVDLMRALSTPPFIMKKRVGAIARYVVDREGRDEG